MNISISHKTENDDPDLRHEVEISFPASIYDYDLLGVGDNEKAIIDLKGEFFTASLMLTEAEALNIMGAFDTEYSLRNKAGKT